MYPNAEWCIEYNPMLNGVLVCFYVVLLKVLRKVRVYNDFLSDSDLFIKQMLIETFDLSFN